MYIHIYIERERIHIYIYIYIYIYKLRAHLPSRGGGRLPCARMASHAVFITRFALSLVTSTTMNDATSYLHYQYSR